MRFVAPLSVLTLALAALPALAQDEAVIEALERRTAEIVRDATPSVVAVTAVTEPPTVPRLVLPGLLLAPVRAESERLDATGFLADASGLVATTAGLAREPARYEVRFADGTTRLARLVGLDEPFRVAVLRTGAPAGARPLVAAPPADPAARFVGWLLSAAGCGEPDAQLTTVRSGQCSSTAYDRWLAAGLPLRAGAAGGPLVGRDGRLLGMAVGGASDRAPAAGAPSGPPAAASVRTTLFVRGDDIAMAVREIARFGEVRRVRMGVLLDEDGNRVQVVLPGGPAERAGVRDGDVVTAVGDTPVQNAADVTRAILRKRPGEVVSFETRRNGEPIRSTLTLDEVSTPPPPAAPPVPGVVLEMSWEPKGDAERDAPVQRVVRVAEVEPGSDAERAGLLPGDEVVSVDGADVLRFLSRCWARPAAEPPGSLGVRRGGEDVAIELLQR